MKDILMVSRAISPPWDEASRNLVKEIISRVDGVKFHILTDKEGVFNSPDIVEHRIYTSRESTFSQKVKLLFFLIANRKKFDIYHLCFTPETVTSLLIKNIIDRRKIIQSIPYLSTKVDSGKHKRLIHSSAVTVTSNSSKVELDAQGAENVKVIYPGVDTELLKPLTSKDEVKRKFSLKGKKHILWAGDFSLDETAGKLFLIIQDILKGKSEVSFVIASRMKEIRHISRQKVLKEKLKKERLLDRVIFLETVEDMPELISACDVLIYPLMKGFSRKIDIPYVVVEAMASGVPVVISDVSPLNEVMKDDAGIAVRGEDPLLIAQGVKKLLDDEALYRDTSRINREAAVKYFNINKLQEGIKEIYGNING